MQKRKNVAKILFIISLVVYVALTIFLSFIFFNALQDGLKAEANNENAGWLGMVAFLVILLVYGTIGYGITFLLNLTSLLLVNIKKEEKNLQGKKYLLMMFIPLLTECILLITSIMITN